MKKSNDLGNPGMGKSHIMNRVPIFNGVPAGPRWMPAWLRKWRARRAWLRWVREHTVNFPLYERDLGDIAMPMPGFPTPRAWTLLDEQKEHNDG